MKKYVFESLKFFCAAILCTILSAFTSPSWGANCNMFDKSNIISGVRLSTIDAIGYEYGMGRDLVTNAPEYYVSPLIEVVAGQEYVKNSPVADAYHRVHYYDSNKICTRIANTNSIEPVAGERYVAFCGLLTELNTAQLEQGTTATEYTPYNPLCETCKNGVSPNLFETVDTTSSLYGVTLTSAANGLVTIVGTATGGGGRNTIILQNFTLPAGTYTVSFSGTKRSQLYLVAGNDSSAQNLITDVNGGTFTISESKTVHFGLNLNNGTTYNDSFYIQVEAGSTATPYQPYGCIGSIKIATTKYNETAFGPLNTALQNAISVVDTVLTQTITQAGRIATLQTQKQTRPNDIADDNEKCPAGKKCLLVEDASGIPHWYEIVTSILPDGYTELQYIESTGTQYINTGVIPTSNTEIEMKMLANTNSGMPYNTAGSVSSSKGVYWLLGGGANANMNATVTSFSTSALTLYTIIQNRNNVILNGNPISYNGVVTDFTGENPLWIGGATSFAFSGRVYSWIVRESGSVVQHLIPAKNSSGVVGMYDTVNNRFYTNAGDGEFIAGPVAE